MDSIGQPPIEFCAERCPQLIRDTLDIIAPKWTVPIFLALHQAPAPLRYADLERCVSGVTPKELARHLKQLVARELVRREVYPTVPPRVEYSLTALGETLYPSLESLARWSVDHGLAAG